MRRAAKTSKEGQLMSGRQAILLTEESMLLPSCTRERASVARLLQPGLYSMRNW